MSAPDIVVTAGASELAELAARRFVQIVSRCQSDAGTARVALSGGSTPRALFRLLARDQFASQIGWTAVEVFWGDERTVPPDHLDSNYRMARETLLEHVPIPEGHIHRMRGEIDPVEAAIEYEGVLTSIFPGADAQHPPRLDLILLGLGVDGHTASLFPRTSALAVRNRLVVANPVPQQQTVRLSLTVPVLLAAHTVLFLVSGADKASAVHRAIEDEWNPIETPSQYLRHAEGRVIWMLDDASAARIAAGRDA